jgi:hypothetical protein
MVKFNFLFPKNKDAKYFWYDSLKGLVVILSILSIPLFLISYWLGLNLILSPLIMGTFIAAVRKGFSALIDEKMKRSEL